MFRVRRAAWAVRLLVSLTLHVLLNELCLLAEFPDNLLQRSLLAIHPPTRTSSRQMTYRQCFRVHALLDQRDANGHRFAIEVAVLGARRQWVMKIGGLWTSGGRQGRTRMVEISCRMSTACCAAARLSISGMAVLGCSCLMLNGVDGLARDATCASATPRQGRPGLNGRGDCRRC